MGGDRGGVDFHRLRWVFEILGNNNAIYFVQTAKPNGYDDDATFIS